MADNKQKAPKKKKSSGPTEAELQEWMRTKGSKGSWTKGMESQIAQFKGKKKK